MKKEIDKKTKFSNTMKYIRIFFNDDTSYYAASLSFFTIFSLLPIFALIIYVLSFLSIVQTYVDQFLILILDLLNPTHSKEFIDTFTSFLSNSDKLGSIGIFYMIFVFTMFFKDYEYIINKIHKVKRKPLYKTFFFYLIFLITLPFSFFILNIVTSFYENTFFLFISSFWVAWILLFYLFKFSVNKEVKNKAEAISSFFTLITMSITKNLFVFYVVYNKTYTTLYGSLSVLLFLFFWIYLSWMIYLYGTKMCHKLNTLKK